MWCAVALAAFPFVGAHISHAFPLACFANSPDRPYINAPNNLRIARVLLPSIHLLTLPRVPELGASKKSAMTELLTQRASTQAGKGYPSMWERYASSAAYDPHFL